MILDGFAGPGGWDMGLRLLGLEAVGIEWDAAACATRAAAGLPTIRADVAAYPRHVFRDRLTGLIMSPPCQAFSKAGRGLGLEDVRGQLIFQVIEWAEDLRPPWIACEQVPQALPIWKAFVDPLRDMGYKVWTGIKSAASFGAPQFRDRAILMASMDDFPLPTETHGPADDVIDLFGDSTLPYVSMADALGWQPDGTVLQPGTWADGRGGNRRLYGLDEPAPTLHFGNDSAGWKWIGETPGWRDRWHQQEGMPSEVDPDWPLRRPATTIAGRGLVPDPGANANADNGKTKSRNNGYRVLPWEAGVLQTFPANYPWQGTVKTIFQQIGNAVPPFMAAAIIKALIS